MKHHGKRWVGGLTALAVASGCLGLGGVANAGTARMVWVPNLVGDTSSAAAGQLVGAGFSAGKPIYSADVSATDPQVRVTSQTARPNTRARASVTIDYVMGFTGLPDGRQRVPDLIGENLIRASDVLTQDYLSPDEPVHYGGNVKVKTQDPLPGGIVAYGTKVEIFASLAAASAS